MLQSSTHSIGLRTCYYRCAHCILHTLVINVCVTDAIGVEFAQFVSYHPILSLTVTHPNPKLGRLFHKMCELYLFSITDRVFLWNNFPDFPYSVGKNIKISSSRWWRFLTAASAIMGLFISYCTFICTQMLIPLFFLLSLDSTTPMDCPLLNSTRHPNLEKRLVLQKLR